MASIHLLFMSASLVHAYTNIDSGFFMRKNIDPIVFPGEYRSHMHDFFGSDVVTVSTNSSEQLRQGCHTNSNPNDFSVYCMSRSLSSPCVTDEAGVPTLYAVVDNERVPVTPNFKVYYENSGEAEIPYPEDLQIIAGNAKASSDLDTDELATNSWWCEYGFEDGSTDHGLDENGFPAATCKLGRVQTILRFQDCVNPDTLEVAYSGRHNLPRVNRCPEGMLRIPQARFSVRYNLSGAPPTGWSGKAPLELASGPAYTFHGDFMNAWDPEAAANMLTQITDKREFQNLEGPFTEQPQCGAQDADPENGTSDYKESVDALSAPNIGTEETDAVEEPTQTSTHNLNTPSSTLATVTRYVTLAPTACS